MWDENHFFVGQELSGDDLDFTGGGNHPVNAGLREWIKLLVLPCILGIGYFDAKTQQVTEPLEAFSSLHE